MEALRIHVERIVRPIRAGRSRKNKMREELLAHLEQRFVLARERGTCEDGAVAFAQANLGDPAQLRTELQETVPVVERVLFVGTKAAVLDAWFDKREGETAFHFAWVRTAYTGLFVLMALVPLIALSDGPGWFKFVTGQMAWDWNDSWALTHAYIPILLIAMAAFAIHFVADVTGIRARLSNKVAAAFFSRATSLGAFVVGYWLFFALAVSAAFIAVRPSLANLFLPLSPSFVFESIATKLVPVLALLILVWVPFLSWAINRQHAHYEKWGRLQIEE